MMKNHKLAKSITDVSWFQFHQELHCQCKKQGKWFTKINQWIPSSKTCNCCRYVKQNLTLSDRTYHCDNCGLSIDRDLNAVINIYKEGLSKFNTVGTTEINACGDMSQSTDSAQEAPYLHGIG